MNQKLIATGVIALLVGAGVGYFGATTFAASGTPSRAAFARTGTGTFAGRGGTGAAGGGFVTGTVASASNGSLTITTGGGSSKVVLTNSSTEVSKNVAGALTDLAVGSNVTITGTTNPDGSVTATLIQIRPAGSTNAPNIPAPTTSSGQ